MPTKKNLALENDHIFGTKMIAELTKTENVDVIFTHVGILKK